MSYQPNIFFGALVLIEDPLLYRRDSFVRPWRERLFSRPWRPWRRLHHVDTPLAFKLGNKFFAHPLLIEQLKREIAQRTAEDKTVIKHRRELRSDYSVIAEELEKSPTPTPELAE